MSYPLLIEAVGRCPPEDVGGPPGYEEFLAALADPRHERHERHAEMLDWRGETFDPNDVDIVQLDCALQKPARAWGPRRKSNAT